MTKFYKLIDESTNVLCSGTTKLFNVKCGESSRDQIALGKCCLYLSDHHRFFWATDNPTIEFVDRCKMVYNLVARDITIVQLLSYLRKNVSPRDLIYNR